MRADRLLSLLLLLQNRGRMTAPQLAAELGVSVRTVYRDIDALGASGVPVYADRGPAGGYRLMAGYRTRLTGLTGSEADSLFLSGLPGPAQDLGIGAVLTTAQLKVRAALPPALAERTRRVQERFHLDATGWFREADDVPHLPRIADAVWEQRTLLVRYSNRSSARTSHTSASPRRAGGCSPPSSAPRASAPWRVPGHRTRTAGWRSASTSRPSRLPSATC